MIAIIEMTRFPGVGQDATAIEIVVGFSEVLLAIIVLAISAKCILAFTQAMTEEKELSEVVKKIRKIMWAGILAACATGILEVVRRAFQ